MLTRHHPDNRALAQAIGIDREGWLSIGLYVAGMVLSMPFPIAGIAMYVVVAIMWLVPDPRIERRLQE